MGQVRGAEQQSSLEEEERAQEQEGEEEREDEGEDKRKEEEEDQAAVAKKRKRGSDLAVEEPPRLVAFNSAKFLAQTEKLGHFTITHNEVKRELHVEPRDTTKEGIESFRARCSEHFLKIGFRDAADRSDLVARVCYYCPDCETMDAERIEYLKSLSMDLFDRIDPLGVCASGRP